VIDVMYITKRLLNVCAPAEDKSGDTKDSFCEELERVLIQLPTYHMKIY
jgi:hypothetical protein